MSDRDATYDVDDSGHPDAYVESEDAGDEDYPPEGGRRKRRGRSIPGCLAALVALALIAGGAYVAVSKGAEFIRDQFSTAADYPGPGRGKVTFEVESGDTVGQIGRNLKAKGVVQSVDAFIEASNGESGIQVGYYQLKKEMRAADAFEILSNPANIIKTTVTIPEGKQVSEIVELLAAATDYPAKAFEKVLADPAKIGLPDYAEDNAEGYLFPSTYDFGPNDKPVDMLKRMVARWQQAADDAGLEEAAAELGYTPHEIMTIASMVEAEGRGDYRAEDRAGHLQPPRDRPEPVGRLPPDRRDRQLRPRQARAGRADDRRDRLGGRLAVQHLPAEGPASWTDRGAGRGLHRGRAQPRGRAVVLLRDHQPGDRRDQVHRQLRRVPLLQGRASGVLRDPVRPLLADRWGAA